MRLLVLVILLSIIAGIIGPSVASVSSREIGPSLGILDVCDPDNPFIDDMPFVNESVRGQLFLAQAAAVQMPIPLGKPALLVFQDERPPEA